MDSGNTRHMACIHPFLATDASGLITAIGKTKKKCL